MFNEVPIQQTMQEQALICCWTSESSWSHGSLLLGHNSLEIVRIPNLVEHILLFLNKRCIPARRSCNKSIKGQASLHKACFIRPPDGMESRPSELGGMDITFLSSSTTKVYIYQLSFLSTAVVRRLLVSFLISKFCGTRKESSSFTHWFQSHWRGAG